MFEKQPKRTTERESNKEKPSSKAKAAKTGDTAVVENFNIYGLPEAIIKNIGSEWLTFQETVKAERAVAPILDKHKSITLFKPTLSELKAAYYVLTGRPALLIRALKTNPALFFKPCMQINDAAGQIFYDVSPADLIDFVCDDDIQAQVARFANTLPAKENQTFIEQWETQRASRGHGGADLVKLADDPMTMPFENVLESTQTHNIWDEPYQLTLPLLKNSDGILYYLDTNKKEHWYYANKDKKTIEPIEIPATLLAEHQDAYDHFKSSMDGMEPNSAKRSSNQEHQLIQTLMRNSATNKAIRLVRQGIRYTRDGIEFCDTHYDFNRMYNVYRKCFRLYATDGYAKADTALLSEHAHRLREVMYIVQHLCDQMDFNDFNRFLYSKSLSRSFNVYDRKNDSYIALFNPHSGVFHADFGSNSGSGFSIYRGELGRASKLPALVPLDGDSNVNMLSLQMLYKDLSQIHRWVNDANKRIAEFKPSLALSRGPTI